MEALLGKCGCDCGNCPSYKGNLGTDAERQCCSQGWEKHLGIKLSPANLRACDGCSLPDQERITYYLNCLVRKCAMINQVDHCGYCMEFPCQELMDVHSLQCLPDRQAFILKHGKWISAEDYRKFVEPYTGLIRLKTIRKSLDEEELKPYKPFSVLPRKAPNATPIRESGKSNLLLGLPAKLLVEENIPYARQQTLMRKREPVLRLLWAVATLGELEKEKGYLEVDSKTLTSLKIRGLYTYLHDYLDILKKHSVHGQIVPVIKSGWQTPSGALRKEGWVLRLRYGNSRDGKEILQNFQRFTRRLEARDKAKAFSRFKAADTLD